MRIKFTLALGLALTAAAVYATLQRSPLTIAATNGIPATARLALIQRATTTCSSGFTLPRDTAAIRLAFAATTGPSITLTAATGGHVLTRGAIASGWYGSAATIPVRPLPATRSGVTLCARVGPLVGDVAMLGEPLSVAGQDPAGHPLPGRVSVAYLRPSQRSWWSRAGSVLDHLALGRAASGRWIAVPIVAFAATAIALASRALTRDLS